MKPKGSYLDEFRKEQIRRRRRRFWRRGPRVPRTIGAIVVAEAVYAAVFFTALNCWPEIEAFARWMSKESS